MSVFSYFNNTFLFYPREATSKFYGSCASHAILLFSKCVPKTFVITGWRQTNGRKKNYKKSRSARNGLVKVEVERIAIGNEESKQKENQHL